ncbi:hypothetical protein Tco_1074812 [Tanacetum coccineum]
MQSIEKCIVERALHDQEIQKRLNDRKLQIQECKVQELKATDANSGDTHSGEFVSDNRNTHNLENDCSKTGNDQSLEKQSSTSRNESSRSRNECSERSSSRNDMDIRHSYDIEPMVEVPYTAEYNVFVFETQHTDQPEFIDDTYVVEMVDSNRAMPANLIANLKLDTNENKNIQKQLKKENASLTHELNECKSALKESNNIRYRGRSALHDQDIELEKCKKYKNCQLKKEEVERFLPTQASLRKSRHAFNVVQHNITNFKMIVDMDWEKQMDNIWQQPITHVITVLVKNLLIPLAIKTKTNANEFERAIKQEMFEDLEYVQSLEKEVDELESEKAEFSNEYDLLF